MIEVWEMSEVMNKDTLSLEDNTVLQMLETIVYIVVLILWKR